MGACGQILILLRDDISELSEENGVKMLVSMKEQVISFFQKEVLKEKISSN